MMKLGLIGLILSDNFIWLLFVDENVLYLVLVCVHVNLFLLVTGPVLVRGKKVVVKINTGVKKQAVYPGIFLGDIRSACVNAASVTPRYTSFIMRSTALPPMLPTH